MRTPRRRFAAWPRGRTIPNALLRKELLQWAPVHTIPASAQVFVHLFGKPGVIEHDAGGLAHFLELDARERIDTVTPHRRSPSLHDPLVRNELDVAASDLSAEQLESAAWLALY